jgi:hypothetical protein
MSDAFDELGARPELYRLSLPHPGLLRHGHSYVPIGEETDLYFSSDYAFPGAQLQALVHSVSDPLKAGYLDAELLTEDDETGIKARDACRLATSVSGPRGDGAELAAGEALAGAMGEDCDIDGSPHKLVRIWTDEAAPEPAAADYGWVPAAGLRVHRAADPTPDSEDDGEVFGGASARPDKPSEFSETYGFDDTIAGALDAVKAVIDAGAMYDPIVGPVTASEAELSQELDAMATAAETPLDALATAAKPPLDAMATAADTPLDAMATAQAKTPAQRLNELLAAKQARKATGLANLGPDAIGGSASVDD